MVKDFSIRNLQEEDYDTLLGWWKYHRFKAPPRFILPDNIADGLMVSHNGIELCSGFLYSTSSSSLFHVEWIVSTPEIKDRTIRKEGLEYLINGIIYVANKKGAKVIYTSLVNPHLIERYKNCGFLEGSTGSTEMVKIL